MRTGYYIKDGKSYGVLQLLTFATKNFTANNNPQPFIDALRGFIAELKSENVPLILDLRRNGGGNGSFPARLLSLLMPESTIFPGVSQGFRMTAYMRQMQEEGLYQFIPAEDLTFGVTSDEITR